MSRGIAFEDIDSVEVGFTRVVICASGRRFQGKPAAAVLGTGPAPPGKFFAQE